MKRAQYLLFTKVFLLLLSVVGFVLAGCNKQPAAPATRVQPTTENAGYDSALTADYDGALDVPTQLALGTIRLEETDDAVTAGQAASLLPLWQSLQSGAITNDSERNAVFKQIEKTMDEAQLAAIRSMQLTQADLTSLGPGVGMAPREETFPQGGTSPQGETRQQGRGQGGQGFDANAMATRRAQMESMSDEERQQLFSQFRQGGGATDAGTTGGSTLTMVMASVVRLLSERSGVAMTLPTIMPAAMPTEIAMQPTETPAAMPTTGPTQTSRPTTEPTPTANAATTVEPTTGLTATPTPLAVAEPTSTPANANPDVPAATSTPQVVETPIPALTQVEDTDPGPPFTIVISSNTAEQDPLVEGSKTYRITGLVRNDGTQTYDVSALHVTFFDADGFRGTFTPAIRDGKQVGGEWNWHGEMDAEFSALLLAPGEAWPFSIAITAQNMASFLIHPDAVVATREWVPVEVSDVRIIQDSTGFVRLTGTATNTGTVKAKNVTIAGTLLDANGQAATTQPIVSVGSTLVAQENIAPGASVHFDLRIERKVFTSYHLYAQAERDWE